MTCRTSHPENQGPPADSCMPQFPVPWIAVSGYQDADQVSPASLSEASLRSCFRGTCTFGNQTMGTHLEAVVTPPATLKSERESELEGSYRNVPNFRVINVGGRPIMQVGSLATV